MDNLQKYNKRQIRANDMERVSKIDKEELGIVLAYRLDGLLKDVPDNIPPDMRMLATREVKRKHGKFVQGLVSYIAFCRDFVEIYKNYNGAKKSDSWLLHKMSERYDCTESRLRRKLYTDKAYWIDYCDMHSKARNAGRLKILDN